MSPGVMPELKRPRLGHVDVPNAMVSDGSESLNESLSCSGHTDETYG